MRKPGFAQFYRPERTAARLARLDPVRVADKLARMPPARKAKVFDLLENSRRLEGFQLLDVAHQEQILGHLSDEDSTVLLEEMDPDDRARLLGELPATAVEKLLAGLSPGERCLTDQLLRFPEESAGRIMTPEFLQLDPAMTVEEALAHIRQRGRQVETIHTLPVTGDDAQLVGMIQLSNLVLAAPDQPVATIMDAEVRAVRADEDQESVAHLLQAADLLAVPVVDEAGRLLGLVTVDDAMDVLSREEEEDLARAGGAEPLRRPYFAVSDFRLARSRIVWLMVLIAAASLTVQVLNAFANTFDKVVALALFIPLLIGTGGNAGASPPPSWCAAWPSATCIPVISCAPSCVRAGSD